jgi:hypothetical protein
MQTAARRRRLVIVAATALLVSPAAARAHGTISPNPVPSGKTRLVISVPNQSVNVFITGFRLKAPAGVTIAGAESEFGFKGAWTAAGAEWSEGSVSPPDTARFAFIAVIPAGMKRVVFLGEELYGEIESGDFPLPVRIDETAVIPVPAADVARETGADRTVVWVGLGLAGLLVALAALLVVGRRRRPRGA